jgi:hypothetical protein
VVVAAVDNREVVVNRVVEDDVVPEVVEEEDSFDEPCDKGKVADSDDVVSEDELLRVERIDVMTEILVRDVDVLDELRLGFRLTRVSPVAIPSTNIAIINIIFVRLETLARTTSLTTLLLSLCQGAVFPRYSCIGDNFLMQQI